MRTWKGSIAAQVALLAAISTPAFGLTIFLPENAPYRYVNASTATTIAAVPANWFEPGFNDSTWSLGTGAFGTSFGGDMGNANEPYAPGPTQHFTGSTDWSVNFDPFLRTTFVLPAPTALTVWIAVDNGVNAFYLNGVSATSAFNAEGTANRWEHVFDVAAQYTFAGLNTIALQVEDHGGGTGFAMVVTSNDATVNPPLSTNPPPVPPPSAVPEPASLALLCAGLLGLAASRRRPG